jgi:hypothetical protein
MPSTTLRGIQQYRQTMTLPAAAHPNARLIETLYRAIQGAQPEAIIACYASDAKFEDIAFRLQGRDEILGMWRLVCHGRPKVTIDFDSISADGTKGQGRWMATYMFGKTAAKPGRKVDNTLTSEFAFREGLIVEHHDRCHPVAWAVQALPCPLGCIIGPIAPLRRTLAKLRLKKFLGT